MAAASGSAKGLEANGYIILQPLSPGPVPHLQPLPSLHSFPAAPHLATPAFLTPSSVGCCRLLVSACQFSTTATTRRLAPIPSPPTGGEACTSLWYWGAAPFLLDGHRHLDRAQSVGEARGRLFTANPTTWPNVAMDWRPRGQCHIPNSPTTAQSSVRQNTTGVCPGSQNNAQVFRHLGFIEMLTPTPCGCVVKNSESGRRQICRSFDTCFTYI